MVKTQIVYWRDIPVQVRVKTGGKRTRFPLSDRFQRAVHRAAYRGKVISGEAYVDEWHPSAWQTQVGEANMVGQALVAKLEAMFTDDELDALAKNKGFVCK